MHLNNLSYTYSMREILSTNGCSKNTTGTSNWQVLKLITCIGNQKMVYLMGNYETDEPLPSGGSGYEVEIPDVEDLERGDPYEGPSKRI